MIAEVIPEAQAAADGLLSGQIGMVGRRTFHNCPCQTARTSLPQSAKGLPVVPPG